MAQQYQERHQDYVIDQTIDKRLASVGAGVVVDNIQLQLDPDAPFLLRQRGYRVKYDNLDSKTQVGLQDVALRFAGPDINYFSADYIPQNLVMPYGGQGGSMSPVFPQVFYPASGYLTVSLVNSGTHTLTNLSLYFRGVKLFRPGAIPSYTYPPKSSLLDYKYPISPDAPYGVTNLLTNESRLLVPFTVKPDTDFVLRALQMGPSYAPFGLEVFITLRDQDQKAYSNLPVHFEMWGPSIGNFQSGAGGSTTAVGTGNSNPGINYPEIYIPKSHQIFYDIVRADNSFAGAATIPNFPITLIGSKVYAQ
jgi:hypothetical protein